MRKLNWKKIVAGTLSAVMLLSVTACGSSSTKSESASTEAGKKELTKVTFCLDWTPNTNHTGIYAAKALGYYEDAGLDVDVAPGVDVESLAVRLILIWLRFCPTFNLPE